MDAGERSGSLVFLFKLLRRSLSRQRESTFRRLSGRLVLLKKNGNIKLFLLSFIFCFKIRPVGGMR